MDRKPEDILARLLSLPVLALLVLMGAIPLLWPLMSKYEGHLFPVVEHVISDNGTPDDDTDDYPLPIVASEYPSPPNAAPYVDVYVQFEKVRGCEFLVGEAIVNGRTVVTNKSLSWYDVAGNRLTIEFEPEHILLPTTRPEGTQIAGPWRVYGTRSVTDTVATVVHRCHPLWLTQSDFHP